MIVSFKTKRLEQCYREYRLAVRFFGEEAGRRYIERINIIKQVNDLDNLLRLPSLRCHPLKGSREGQYAAKLTGFYRLIFTLEGESLEIVRIEEVSKHYDD